MTCLKFEIWRERAASQREAAAKLERQLSSYMELLACELLTHGILLYFYLPRFFSGTPKIWLRFSPGANLRIRDDADELFARINNLVLARQR